MKQAICMPYDCDQNEPSRPIPEIITLPDDKAQRNTLLRKLFIKHVCEDAKPIDIRVIKGRSDDFGDLIVYWGHGLYLYVIYVKEAK